MEAHYHSSGTFTLDLHRALDTLTGDAAPVHASEALAFLVASLRLWQPSLIEVQQQGWALRIRARDVRCDVDPLALITRNVLLPRGEVPLPVFWLAMGLRNLLRVRGLDVRFCGSDGVIRQLTGHQQEQAQPGCSEFFLRGLFGVDVAWVRRRLRFFPIAITWNGEPLPLVGSVPSSPEFLFEAFDLRQPFPGEPFAGWSAGPARLDFGSEEYGQLRHYQRGRVQVVGRCMAAGGAVLVSFKHPRPDWIFGGARLHAPACGALCSLELKPRSRTRWVAVTNGLAQDSVEIPTVEPGWRIYLAAPLDTDKAVLQRRALEQLAWARACMAPLRRRLAELRSRL
jgi:hypothetical protein